MLRVIGPLFFAAAEGLFTDLETRITGKRIVVLKWDAVPVLDAGGLDAFQRFVKRLPEGCELRISNLGFNRYAPWRVRVSNHPRPSGVLPEP